MRHAKRFYAVLAVVLAVIMFAGCSTPAPTAAPTVAPTVAPTAAPTAAATAAPTAAPAANAWPPAATQTLPTLDPNKTYNVSFLSWCMQQDWLDAILKPLTDKYPNLHVTLTQIYAPADYIAAQKLHYAAGDLDITSVRPESLTEFYKAGMYTDLTGEPFLSDWNSQSYFKNSTFDGKIYGCPGTIDFLGIYYNKTMFAANGWQVPTSWDSFVSLCDTIKNSGKVKYVMSNGASGDGLWTMIMDNGPFLFAPQVADPQFYRKIDAGQAKWTDQPYLDMFNNIQAWYKKGYISPNLTSMTMDDANQEFLVKQDSAMMLQGEFFGQTYMGYKAPFDMGVFPMYYPGVTSPDQLVEPLLVADQNVILSNSKNKDAALVVLNQFYSPDGSQTRMKQQGCITSSTATDPASAMNDYEKLFLPLLKEPSAGFWWCEYNSDISDLLNKNLQQMFNGSMTPQQMVTSLQSEEDKWLATQTK